MRVRDLRRVTRAHRRKRTKHYIGRALHPRLAGTSSAPRAGWTEREEHEFDDPRRQVAPEYSKSYQPVAAGQRALSHSAPNAFFGAVQSSRSTSRRLRPTAPSSSGTASVAKARRPVRLVTTSHSFAATWRAVAQRGAHRSTTSSCPVKAHHERLERSKTRRVPACTRNHAHSAAQQSTAPPPALGVRLRAHARAAATPRSTRSRGRCESQLGPAADVARSTIYWADAAMVPGQMWALGPLG